jgi:hypothetical protein
LAREERRGIRSCRMMFIFRICVAIIFLNFRKVEHVDIDNFKNSPFATLLFFVCVLILGALLGFFNAEVVQQKWLSFISVGIVIIGSMRMFFSYFYFLGLRVQTFIDWLKNIFNK